MWNTDEKIRGRKIALADGGYADYIRRQEREKKDKLSCAGAMVLGVIVTLEIMVAGAMILNYDFHGADMIALFLVFLVLYFGVVAALTNK